MDEQVQLATLLFRPQVYMYQLPQLLLVMNLLAWIQRRGSLTQQRR